MGMLHAGILNSLKEVKIIALADTENFVNNLLKKSLPNVKIFDDYKKMIDNTQLDLIYITTPVQSHVEIAEYCANQNIPFFIEKPISRNALECKSLYDILLKNETINMVGFYLRYVDSFVKAKEILENNILGKIIKINAYVSRPLILNKQSGWRFNKKLSGGGVLIDIGISLVDLLVWYFGKVKHVNGNCEHNYLEGIEDFVEATLTFENNIECELEATWNIKNARIQETNIEIQGELGILKVNEDYAQVIFKENPSKKQKNLFYSKVDLFKGVEFDIGGTMYTKEDTDFVKCIKMDKQSFLNLKNSLVSQSIVDSIYKSDDTKKLELVDYIE